MLHLCRAHRIFPWETAVCRHHAAEACRALMEGQWVRRDAFSCTAW